MTLVAIAVKHFTDRTTRLDYVRPDAIYHVPKRISGRFSRYAVIHCQQKTLYGQVLIEEDLAKKIGARPCKMCLKLST